MANIQVRLPVTSYGDQHVAQPPIGREQRVVTRQQSPHQGPLSPWEEHLLAYYRFRRAEADPADLPRLEIQERENLARLRLAVDLRDGRVQPPAEGGFEPAPKPETTDPTNMTIFVGGLNVSASHYQDIIKAVFLVFGQVEYVNFPRDRNCAFVRLKTRLSAENAITKLQGFSLESCAMRLSWGRGGPGVSHHKGPGVTSQSMAQLIQYIPIADAQPILNAIEEVFQGNLADFHKALGNLAASHQLVRQSDAITSSHSRGPGGPATAGERTNLRGNRPQGGNNSGGVLYGYPGGATPPDSDEGHWGAGATSQSPPVTSGVSDPVFTMHDEYSRGRYSHSSEESLQVFEMDREAVSALTESLDASNPFPSYREQDVFAPDNSSPPVEFGQFADPWSVPSIAPPSPRQTSIPDMRRSTQYRSRGRNYGAVGETSTAMGLRNVTHSSPPPHLPRALPTFIRPGPSYTQAQSWVSAGHSRNPPDFSISAMASSNGTNPAAMPWNPPRAASRSS